MRCDEFRAEFDLRLDPAEQEKLTEEMKSHLTACVRCGRYARAMEAVDGALRAHSVQPVPPDLRQGLFSIPLRAMHAETSTARFLRRGAWWLAAALALAFLSLLLPPEYQFWPRLAIATAAFTMVFVASLARKLIATSYE
jgi:predicted anti-sigma-YlaC factor YlaD